MNGLETVLFGVGALLVRVGLAWYAAGLSRSKNAAGAVLRQVVDLCVAILVFWAIGAALFEASSAVLGIRLEMLFGWRASFDDTNFFHLVLVLIATGIVPGTLSERTRFWPLVAISALLAGVLVPIAAQWVWHGWLDRYGILDVGGATVLHLTGGLTAGVAALFVGPRNGKYNRDGSSNFIPGHSVPLASVGVVILLVSWVAYLTGVAHVQDVYASLVPMNVLLAGAAGGAAALFFTQIRYGKPDLFLIYSGLLGGLVAISAGAGHVSSLGAVIIGGVAGVLVPICTVKLDVAWKLDDPTGAVAVHVIGAMWGMLAAPFFLVGMHWNEILPQLGAQALGLAVIGALALALSIGLLAVLKATAGLRAKEADEYDGLDLAEHDVNAYPDFQQTMIKSYHLREA